MKQEKSKMWCFDLIFGIELHIDVVVMMRQWQRRRQRRGVDVDVSVQVVRWTKTRSGGWVGAWLFDG